MSKFIFEDMFPDRRHIDNEGAESVLWSKAKIIENQFTGLVDRMRNPEKLPCSPINDLMTLFWRLVGNRYCPTAMTGVDSLSFFMEVHGSDMMAVIMVPENWPSMLKADLAMQMGAMVFSASKAQDYWNLRSLRPHQAALFNKRAFYHEQILLKFLQEQGSLTPNEYQTKVLGMTFDPVELDYPKRAWGELPGLPPFPVDMSLWSKENETSR